MINNAFVTIWGNRVGAIAWNNLTGLGSFEFDPAFVRRNMDLSPLKMPLGDSSGRIYVFPELRNISAFKGLPGLLADVLPDKFGNMLINTWLTRRGRATDSMNPVEMLCFIGRRSMGALEFEPPLPKGKASSTAIEIEELIKITNEILSGRLNFSADLSENEEKAILDILKIGVSAGGARAKAVIAFNTTTGEVRSGQADVPAGFSHWIIKFDGVSDNQLGSSKGYGRVEMAYHLMAKEAEIEMSECQLLEENGRAHFMTRRFDREADNEKIHMQSFCALQHFDFNDINSYSYEQLFETMRLLGLPYPQAEQVFRRMVFNVLARNCDDHTKNFAFLMNKQGEWKLSPAFDVCHAFRPGSSWVSRHSLSVNGKRENISVQDFLAVARQMNIKKGARIINHVNSIVQDWKKYAEKTGVGKELKDAIQGTMIKAE